MDRLMGECVLLVNDYINGNHWRWKKEKERRVVRKATRIYLDAESAVGAHLVSPDSIDYLRGSNYTFYTL